MGYGITGYRVNLSRMNTRFSHEKAAKRSAAKNACIENISNWDVEEGDPTHTELIDELIDESKASYNHLGYKYWYAIEGLISDLGTCLDNSEWYPCDPEVFEDDFRFKMYNINTSFEIPTPDDFPSVLTFFAEDMTEEATTQISNKIDDEDQKNSFLQWVKAAKRYKQDIVLFYY